jgi:hypothetical protein
MRNAAKNYWLPVSDGEWESNRRDEMYSNRQICGRMKVHSMSKLRRDGQKDAFSRDLAKPTGTIDKQII